MPNTLIYDSCLVISISAFDPSIEIFSKIRDRLENARAAALEILQNMDKIHNSSYFTSKKFIKQIFSYFRIMFRREISIYGISVWQSASSIS